MQRFNSSCPLMSFRGINSEIAVAKKLPFKTGGLEAWHSQPWHIFATAASPSRLSAIARCMVEERGRRCQYSLNSSNSLTQV